MDESTSEDATSKTDTASSESKGEAKDSAEEKSKSSEGNDEGAFVVEKILDVRTAEGKREFFAQYEHLLNMTNQWNVSPNPFYPKEANARARQVLVEALETSKPLLETFDDNSKDHDENAREKEDNTESNR